MERKFLKELGLDDEQIDKIMAENGKDIQTEQAKATAATTSVEDLKKQIAERDADLKQLRESAGSNDELKSKYDELQAKYEADTNSLTEKMAALQRDTALDKAIAAAKGRNPKAIKALLDREGLKLKDDGTLEGLDLTGIQTSDPYLFESISKKDEGNTPPAGNPPASGVNQASFNANINNVSWMQENMDAVLKGLADGTITKG